MDTSKFLYDCNLFEFGDLMAFEKTEWIWHNGKIVKWDEAKTSVATWSLHYGVSFFEGIRAYWNGTQLNVVRLKEHIKRMFNSAKIYDVTIPYTPEELEAAVIETLKKNNMKTTTYIRPIVYFGEMKALGLHPGQTPVNVAIFVLPFGRYLGPDALEKGIKVAISSWRKIPSFCLPQEAKCGANYANSYLTALEAAKGGYEEALLLDHRGFICEGPGENFFMIKNGELHTAPKNASILDGITRDCLIRIAKDENILVVERDLTRGEAYAADEAFFTGTAGEVTPITSIDGRVVGNGKAGEMTKKLQAVYFDAVNGKNPKYKKWITPVY